MNYVQLSSQEDHGVDTLFPCFSSAELQIRQGFGLEIDTDRIRQKKCSGLATELKDSQLRLEYQVENVRGISPESDSTKLN